MYFILGLFIGYVVIFSGYQIYLDVKNRYIRISDLPPRARSGPLPPAASSPASPVITPPPQREDGLVVHINKIS